MLLVSDPEGRTWMDEQYPFLLLFCLLGLMCHKTRRLDSFVCISGLWVWQVVGGGTEDR